MKKNMGTADRYIRFIVGVGLILNIFALDAAGWSLAVLLILAAIMFKTSITGYCLLYMPFKISTLPQEGKTEEKAEEPAA